MNLWVAWWMSYNQIKLTNMTNWIPNVKQQDVSGLTVFTNICMRITQAYPTPSYYWPPVAQHSPAYCRTPRAGYYWLAQGLLRKLTWWLQISLLNLKCTSLVSTHSLNILADPDNMLNGQSWGKTSSIWLSVIVHSLQGRVHGTSLRTMEYCTLDREDGANDYWPAQQNGGTNTKKELKKK